MPIVPVDCSPSKPETQVDRQLPPARARVRQPVPSASLPLAEEASLPHSSDYLVGRGRPPVHTRFKPGTSGNPKGRPKGAKGLNTLARELLTAKVPVRTASGEKKMQRIEAVLHKAFELASKGNPRALSQILSLYASAVPEKALSDASPVDELTTTDLAILDELKVSLLREIGQ